MGKNKKIYLLYLFISPIIYTIFRIFPIRKNKVVFVNSYGNGYGCNPKYIAEEFLKLNEKYDLVWEVNSLERNENSVPERIRLVKFYSIKGIYELATAKCLIVNILLSTLLTKRSKQIFIQTWHGFGIKGDTDNQNRLLSAIRHYYTKHALPKMNAQIIRSDIERDYYENPSQKNINHYAGYFLSTGSPRDSIFFTKNNEIYNKIFSKYNIESNSKIILYAPTFRKLLNNVDFEIDWDECISTVEKRFGGNWIVFLRYHPAVSNTSYSGKSNAKIVNVSQYPDMQELLYIADIMITDYSSCSFDFANTENPCILYVPDCEEYINNDWGLRNPLETLPFLVAYNHAELIKILAELDYDKYRQEIKQFNKEQNPFESVNSAKNATKWIINTMKIR